MAAETRLVKGDLRTAGWQIAFNPNSEVGLGSTGDPPVPDGHWPDGTGRTLIPATAAQNRSHAFPIPSGGSPLGTGQWPVPPIGVAIACFGIRV
jgi:hypothetical protein